MDPALAPESFKAIDTNGAGDIYAGAYLALVAQGADVVDATRFANYAAAQLVTHLGARLHSTAEYAALKAAFNG